MIDQSKLLPMFDWYVPVEKKPVEDPIIDGTLHARWPWYAGDWMNRIRAQLAFLSITHTHEMFGPRNVVFKVKGRKSDIDKLNRWVDENFRGDG